MGVKMLNLQAIHWWFQLLGNRFHCVKLQQPEPPATTIKLVKSDGLVKIYDRPIQASELMSEFPKHLVCRSDSLYIGQKIPALSEADQLQLGHIYFLLPNHCFQSALSFVTIASLANYQTYSQLPRLPEQPFSSSSSSPSSSSFSRSETSYSADMMRKSLVKKMTACRQPFHIQKTQSGGLRIRVSDEFISKLTEQGNSRETEEDDESRGGRVCTTAQLHKDYKQLVGSRLIWKPKLDTIRESTEKRKLNLSSSFGMMSNRNITVKKSSDGQPSSSSSSSKGLIIHKHNNKTSSPQKSASASQHHLHLHNSASPKHHLPSYNSKSKTKTKKIKINIKSRK